jgi:hypothetical protein
MAKNPPARVSLRLTVVVAAIIIFILVIVVTDSRGSEQAARDTVAYAHPDAASSERAGRGAALAAERRAGAESRLRVSEERRP